MNLIKLLLNVFLGSVVISQTTWADVYPDRSVTIVVAFPAGSGTDLATRIIANHAEKVFGKPFLILNKAGANGTIGANFVARSASDGYVLLATSNTPMGIAPAMMEAVPYDPIRDFEPILKTGTLPSVLVSSKKNGFASLDELRVASRERPGTINAAYGNGTGLVASAYFAEKIGAQFVNVSYQGTPQAITDLIGGQVNIMFSDLTAAAPFIKSDKVSVIGITTRARHPAFPAVKTLLEQGVADFEIAAWNGIFAPKNTPPAVIEKVRNAFSKSLDDARVIKQLQELGFDVNNDDKTSFRELFEKDVSTWKSMIEKYKLKSK